MLKDPKIEEKSREIKNFRESAIRLTLSRMPRFISKIVEKTQILFKTVKGKNKQFTGGYRKRDHIVIYYNEKPDLQQIIKILAHEYWHVFEHSSGFREGIKEDFENTIKEVKMGDFSINVMNDFKEIVKMIDYYGDHDFIKKVDEMHRVWTMGNKDYFNRFSYPILEDIESSLKNQNLYKTISEHLAETLSHIVTNKPSDVPSQSLVHWMNSKFSSKTDEMIVYAVVKRLTMK